MALLQKDVDFFSRWQRWAPHYYGAVCALEATQQMRDVDPMLIPCRATVSNGGPT